MFGSLGAKMYNKKKRRKKTSLKIKSARKQLFLVFSITVLIIIGAAALLINSPTASSKGMTVLIDDGKIFPGVSINGIAVGGLSRYDALRAIAAEADRYKQEELKITLIHEDTKIIYTADDLGLEPDVEKAVDQALMIGRSGSIQDRKEALENPENYDIELGYIYDPTLTDSKIRPLIENISILKVEPRPRFENGDITFTEGKPGLNVSFQELTEMVKKEIADGTFQDIQIPGELTNPEHTVEEFQEKFVLLSKMYTWYGYSSSAQEAGRVHNLETMAAFINDSVIEPGETFSINNKTGPRNDPSVWKEAFAIVNKGYKKELAGGVCQVSTTLYLSVLKADLKVVERLPHSIPSSYCDLGFDATLSFASDKDFKFTNNSDWPVYIRAYLDKKTKRVYCEIYGKQREDELRIDLEYEILEHLPAPSPLYTMDKQEERDAHDYYRVQTYKLFKDKNGNLVKKEKIAVSTYRAIQGIIYGTDPSLSPSPLPTDSPGPTSTQTPEPGHSAEPFE